MLNECLSAQLLGYGTDSVPNPPYIDTAREMLGVPCNKICSPTKRIEPLGRHIR